MFSYVDGCLIILAIVLTCYLIAMIIDRIVK
jgi:hypothetical protein